MKRFSSRRRRFAKLLLVLFGLVLGSLIAEIALRITGYSYPEFYKLDYSRGYALRPDIQGWYRKEGEAYIQTNRDGLRDRDHSQTKPANTIRIAVLGDSYVEALQVSQDQAFWAVMEKLLQDCPTLAGKKVEVINFGVSGYGTAQELITLREDVWQYSPDLVLLAATTNNDITDNSRALKKTDEVPYFVYRDGTLTLDDSFKNSRPFRLRQAWFSRLGRWFKDHSRLVQALNEGHHALKILSASWREKLKRPSPAVSHNETETVVPRTQELGIDNQIYLEPSDKVWNEAWRVTEELIKQMASEVKSHGAQFVVVTLSNPPQVIPDENLRNEFLKRIGAKDIFYPDNRIRAVCEKAGIAVISLAPELQHYADEHNAYLHGFGTDIGNGHWNPLGHRVAGEILARKLCQGAFVK